MEVLSILAVFLLCLRSSEGELLQARLVGSTTSYKGRVEVSYNGTWGTVCNHGWDAHDARVVCRMLGLYSGSNVQATAWSTSGSGSQPIWMDNVDCVGTESNIGLCSQSGWGTHSCGLGEYAGVVCSQTAAQVRLVNGSSPYEGRVEVLYDDWGTVCDDHWTLNEVTVICRMLGVYASNDFAAFTSGHFGNGASYQKIVMDDVYCSGNEQNIGNCELNGWGLHNCDHTQDAGVRCLLHGETVQARLVGGSTMYEGRVEVLYGGFWDTVCDDYWDANDARVICRMLGFYSGDGVQAVSGGHFGQGLSNQGIALDNVNCSGNEANIGLCVHRGWEIHDCSHSEDAGVRCYPPGYRAQVRIVGTIFPFEGRVEVFHNNQWGTICDDSWDVNDARVVCRMLGLYDGPNVIAKVSAYFGSGPASQPILLDEMICSGSESNIEFCSHSSWGNHDCDHSEDAGVICRPAPSSITAMSTTSTTTHSTTTAKTTNARSFTSSPAYEQTSQERTEQNQTICGPVKSDSLRGLEAGYKEWLLIGLGLALLLSLIAVLVLGVLLVRERRRRKLNEPDNNRCDAAERPPSSRARDNVYDNAAFTRSDVNLQPPMHGPPLPPRFTKY